MDVSAARHAEAVSSERTAQIARSADGDIITGCVNYGDKSGVAGNSGRAGPPGEAPTPLKVV